MDEKPNVGLPRRDFLGIMAGSPLLLSTKEAWGASQSSEFLDGTNDISDLNFPEGTLEEALFPFIKTPGFMQQLADQPNYPGYPVNEVAEQLRPLYPDSLMMVDKTAVSKAEHDEFTAWGAGLLAFMLPTPTTAHRDNIVRQDDRDWYNSLPTSEKYEWPDSSPVEDLADLAGEDFRGNSHELYGQPVPSPLSPGTVDHHLSSLKPFLRQGYSIAYLDQTNYVSRKGLDFSRWGQSAFREHLQSLSEERRSELGIDNPSSFDIREYFRSNDVINSDNHPAKDPVFREYFLHQHKRIREFYQELTDELANGDYPASDISVHPNLGTGDDLRFAPATAVYAADAFNVAAFEPYDRLPTVPPAEITDYRYKLFQAAGRFERPALQYGNGISTGDAEELGAEPKQEPYTTLSQLQAGEAFAHGGRVSPELLSSIHDDPHHTLTRWMKVDGSVPDELATFVDFVRSNRRFIEDVAPSNHTAVVFSLPTMLWNYIPQTGWGTGIHPSQYLDSFIGAASLLRDHHIPYDVTIFDHPEVWSAPEQLDRLSSYDTVILPLMDAVSEAQLSTLETLLDQGVSVIVSGSPPNRDVMYEHTDQAASLLGEHENARILETDPTGQYSRDESDGGSFIATIDEISRRQLELSVDDAVGVNILKQPTEDRFVVHLVNYEYDLQEDQTRSVPNIEVTIRDPPISPIAATYYTKGSAIDLDVSTTGDGAKVTVPELNVWGFIVFAADPDALESGDRTSAEQAVQDATDAVSKTRADNRTEGLAKAENALSSARSELEYGAYEQAVESAERAVASAESAYRTPCIGIDTAHRQSEAPWGGFEALQQTRDFFSSYEYKRLTEWSSEEFAEIDLLLVPPALEFPEDSDGFSQTELDELEQFVANGGSLLVLAPSDVALGFNDLLGRFGFEVDPTVGIIPDGRRAVASTAMHTLTKIAPVFDVTHGTPLQSIPNATVVGNVREQSDSDLSNDSGSAAGEPVYAVMSHENGHVAVMGTANPFLKPAETPNIVWNAIYELSRVARISKRESQESDTRTESSSTEREDTDNEDADNGGADDRDADNEDANDERSKNDTDVTVSDDGGPGFGIGGTLAAIGGVSYLLKRRFEEEAEEK